ncbi:MAG TPA: hypothetical protein VNJ07_03960 [Chitinophagales bacterium]|nr:hypothetical protein [Chitinophagales bacterium]
MSYPVSKMICILLAASCAAAMAQPPKNQQEKKEKMEQLKIAFITQKLNLTRQEAQKFWPVYNEYHDALDALRKERKEELKNYRTRFDELSEKELTEMVDKQIIYRQRELDLLKKYHAEYKSILPVKKVAMLYRAEDEFKAKVLQEIKDRD